MSGTRTSFASVLACVMLLYATHVAAQDAKAPAPLPSRSLYHATASFTDQHGAHAALGVFRGHPVLIVMFYASCKSVCPVIFAQVQRIERELPPDARAETRMILISLDPKRDTSARLAALAKRMHVDGDRWRFLRTSDGGVQEIAALLGVSFRRLPSGEIDHSALVTLLDGEGVVRSRLEGAFADPGQLVTDLVALVRSRK